MGLFYAYVSYATELDMQILVFFQIPHKGKSPVRYAIRYTILSCNVAISWKPTMKTLTATSSNYAKILMQFEANKSCVWKRLVVKHLQGSCKLGPEAMEPTATGFEICLLAKLVLCDINLINA